VARASSCGISSTGRLGQAIERGDQEVGAEPCEVAFNILARFVGINRPVNDVEHRAGIERFHDAHDRDPV
jgi:hypothetical protein